MWIAAYRGVARLDLSTAAWKTYTREDGLASDQAWSITGGPGLAAWLPLRDSAGIAYFDGTSWTHYTSEDGLPSDDVRTISVARDGSVWFATTEGAFRWDREAASGELQAVGTWTYYTSAAGLYSDQVEKVLFTPDGRIWFAHLGALTYLLPASSEGEHDTWGTYGQSRFLATRKAMVSRDGRLWVGQALFDPASQEWIDTTYRDLHLQGLTVDRRGGLWIARQDGALYLPDPVSGSRDTWLYYGQAQGLASDDVFVIALESDGVVWFGTRNGASRCVLE